MRYHIDRETVYIQADVGAVVTIETTEKYLFRLAASLVLTDEKTRDDAQYFLGICNATQGDVYFTDGFEGVFRMRSHCYGVQLDDPAGQQSGLCGGNAGAKDI